MGDSDTSPRKILGSFNFVPITPRPSPVSVQSPSPLLVVLKSPLNSQTPVSRKPPVKCEFCDELFSCRSSLNRHKKGGRCSVLKVDRGEGESEWVKENKWLKSENKGLNDRLAEKEAQCDALLANKFDGFVLNQIVDPTALEEELKDKNRNVRRIQNAISRQKRRVGILRKSLKTIEKKRAPIPYSSFVVNSLVPFLNGNFGTSVLRTI